MKLRLRYAIVWLACLPAAACQRQPDPAKVIVGDWEARIPNRDGGHDSQLMTFRSDGKFLVQSPPVRGKECRSDGTYRLEPDGRLATSIPGAERLVMTVISVDEVQFDIDGNRIILRRLSPNHAKLLAATFEEKRLKQQSVENLDRLRKANRGSAGKGVAPGLMPAVGRQRQRVTMSISCCYWCEYPGTPRLRWLES